VAEILRSGIGSIPKGQFEAAKMLKIPTLYTWKDIIFPQVFAHIFPAMIGEIIALLKETALIATIGGADVMRRSQMVAAESFTYFIPLCIAGLYYYIIVLIIEYIGKKWEGKICHAKR
jgi:polar amino acid transport system permease protein